jgi:hypothetical protein
MSSIAVEESKKKGVPEGLKQACALFILPSACGDSGREGRIHYFYG